MALTQTAQGPVRRARRQRGSPPPAGLRAGSRPYVRAAQGTRESFVAAVVALGALSFAHQFSTGVDFATLRQGLVQGRLRRLEAERESAMSNLCQTFTRCWRRGAPPFHSVVGMQDGAGMRAGRRRAGRAFRQ